MLKYVKIFKNIFNAIISNRTQRVKCNLKRILKPCNERSEG